MILSPLQDHRSPKRARPQGEPHLRPQPLRYHRRRRLLLLSNGQRPSSRDNSGSNHHRTRCPSRTRSTSRQHRRSSYPSSSIHPRRPESRAVRPRSSDPRQPNGERRTALYQSGRGRAQWRGGVEREDLARRKQDRRRDLEWSDFARAASDVDSSSFIFKYQSISCSLRSSSSAHPQFPRCPLQRLLLLRPTTARQS